MTTLRPLFDRVYVKRTETQKQTSGGLYIPENSKEKSQTGTVIALGSGKQNHTFHVKVGDRVIFNKFAGTELDDTHVLLKEEEILAVIE